MRLHIIANSNSIEDQIIKLKISDKINNYIKDISKNLNSREDLVKTVYNNKEKLLQISNEELKQNTKNYSSTLKLGKIHYEKKQSINLDMPSGTYQSINITLGEGNGKNIWSLIFPNEKNIESIAGYETILPGISNIFNHNNAINKNNTYDIKILEIFNKLKVGL
ncbi:MAG: stage II sporulation protein R [Clostridia bacterium]